MYELCIVFTTLQQKQILIYIINNQTLSIRLASFKLFYL